ncbi:MAG: hypothetical protein J5486_04880 [Bacteroidaceae bacterium]|nr:hypothetical protein [Bacteroidaceae bacterium]
MKKLFLSLIALALPLFAGAQVTDIRTATLIHGNETKVYYGEDAFKDAYNAAAQSGDVIVLSSGNFNDAPSITKSISIYGAGYETDTIAGTEPTSISSISIAPVTGYDDYGTQIKIYPKVYLEGLLLLLNKNSYSDRLTCLYIAEGGNIDNLIVRKCKMTGALSINATSTNCRFIQCVFMNHIGYSTSGSTGRITSTGFKTEQSQLSFENCWIRYAAGSSLTSTITFNHCIIYGIDSWYVTSGSKQYAHFTNNIIVAALPENCTAYNNIFISTSIGTNVTGENNWVNIVTSGIFEPDNGLVYSATNNYIIRFPKKYVGTDGTEVGINGGSYPFNRLSSVPRILQSDIDLTTTEDKKLNVSIKVEAQTK